MPIKFYLGDGVYIAESEAADDFILTTENGIEITNTIYLEREILASLIIHVKRIWDLNLRMDEEEGLI